MLCHQQFIFLQRLWQQYLPYRSYHLLPLDEGFCSVKAQDPTRHYCQPCHHFSSISSLKIQSVPLHLPFPSISQYSIPKHFWGKPPDHSTPCWGNQPVRRSLLHQRLLPIKGSSPSPAECPSNSRLQWCEQSARPASPANEDRVDYMYIYIYKSHVYI